MLDFYLSDQNKAHWAEIQKLAHSDNPEAFEKLKRYALEAYRLTGPAFGLLRVVDADTATIQDGSRTVTVKKNEQIYVNFVRVGPLLILNAKKVVGLISSLPLGLRRSGSRSFPRPATDQARSTG